MRRQVPNVSPSTPAIPSKPNLTKALPASHRIAANLRAAPAASNIAITPRRSLLALIALIALLALSAPTFAITALSPADPSLQGTTLASETFTIDLNDGSPDSPLIPVLFLDEKVVQNTAGTLDFYFKLRNISAPQPLLGFYLTYPNSIQASAFYVDEGNLTPISGGAGGFDFGNAHDIVGPLIGSGGTDTLVLRTNATAYTTGTVEAPTASIDDFGLQPATALVPAANPVPELATLTLLPLALVALTTKLRRQ